MRRRPEERGSVVLVALCCVTVLGIALASYLAVSNQAMKLSNRSYQSGVSKALAESGLEQALWTFNRNNWDPAVWTIDATNHRATRTITFPNSKYGNNVTGSVNLRVDNYDAYYRGATWTSSPSTNYRINDLVAASDGMWYRCVKNNASSVTNAPGNLAYWAPAPLSWMWSPNTSYKAGTASTNASVVCYNGTWYYCKTNTNSGTFIAGTEWTSMPLAPSFSWDNSTNYPTDSFVYSAGTWYRSISGSNTGNPPPDPSFWDSGAPNISWAYRAGATYNFNDLVYTRVSGVDKWYRCTSASPGAPPTGWEDALNVSWGWSSSLSYNLNDVVFFGGSFYRCILAHSNQMPTAPSYWANTPLLPASWNSGRQYSANDVVYCNGTWFLSLQNSNTGNYPVTKSDTASPFWAPAPASLAAWDATQNYNVNDLVSASGIWYRCIAAHLNQPTTNASFWTAINGATYQWDPATGYSTTSYVSYGGAWYRCIAAHTNQSPNNRTYWTALGAPVIYAEGVAALPDSSTPIRTQLRANVARAPLFPNAAAATSTLKINGAGTVDSYDSIGDPSASVPGYSAVLASTATATPAITVTATTVKGYVAVPSSGTSPFNPQWNYGGSALLTSPSTGSGVDLTRVSRSPYVPQFDPLPQPSLASGFTLSDFPQGTALSLSATLNLGTAGGVTPSRYYYDGSLDIGSSSTVNTININGPVILFVNGYLRVRTGGKIEIKSSGSAEIHCGYLRTYANGDGIYNRTLDPKKLIVIAESTSSFSTYFDNGGVGSTNKDFYGVLYAPNTTASLGFEVRSGVRVFGALSAKKITFPNEATLHYDTSLRYATFGGIDTPFTLTEWRELTDQSERVTLP